MLYFIILYYIFIRVSDDKFSERISRELTSNSVIESCIEALTELHQFFTNFSNSLTNFLFGLNDIQFFFLKNREIYNEENINYRVRKYIILFEKKQCLLMEYPIKHDIR